ncbi:MAG: hypothetical protein ABIC04_08550 [Nanoarchaeota archaeon]
MELPEKKKSDKILLVTISIIFIILISILSIKYFYKPETSNTIDELHQLNLEGKLDPMKGYMYNGYSFVNVDGFWFTEMKSQSGRTLYSLDFRFGPKEVTEVEVRGKLNIELFDSANDYYITYNPVGQDFRYEVLAVGDINQHMLKVFKKNPIAACDRNETGACKVRPIIKCDNTDKLVFYINKSTETSVEFKDNCIVINGDELDLVKAVDKLLYLLYNIY